jgi:hypothetical protein
MTDLLREASQAAAFWPDRFPAKLDSVAEKLRRADEHRRGLADEVDRFTSQPPYRVTESFDGGIHTLVAEVRAQPPTRFAIILGDVLYNLRSALDHLIWQFALTTTSAPHRFTAFPIYDSAEDFKAKARIRDMPPGVAQLLEAMQPYQPGDTVLGWLGRELVDVRNMGNRDKHQTVHIVTALVEPKYVERDDKVPGQVQFSASRDRQRATIQMPLGSVGHFEALVTIPDDELPWRSGIDGIADHLIKATQNAIAAFSPLSPLLRQMQR